MRGSILSLPGSRNNVTMSASPRSHRGVRAVRPPTWGLSLTGSQTRPGRRQVLYCHHHPPASSLHPTIPPCEGQTSQELRTIGIGSKIFQLFLTSALNLLNPSWIFKGLGWRHWNFLVYYLRRPICWDLDWFLGIIGLQRISLLQYRTIKICL